MKNSHTVSRTLLLLVTSCLASCASWPGLKDPSLTVAPKISLYRVHGTTQMQHNNVAQAAQTAQDLGTGTRDEELAGRLSYGDGFSGFDLDYLVLSIESTEPGQAKQGWGTIRPGEAVNSSIDMDEVRLRYIAILPWGYGDEDSEIWFKTGAGLQLTHREFNFTVTETNGTGGTNNSQKIEIKDDLSPMLAVRLAGGRGPLDMQIDYAVNGDWGLGTGDLNNWFFDFAVQANYYLEAQDLTLFGGYRRFDIRAKGSEGSAQYRTDFTLDGLFFGFRFLF